MNIIQWINKLTSPEGCTAADARVLRDANHKLADQLSGRCKDCKHRIKYTIHSECFKIQSRYLEQKQDGAYPMGYEAEGISVDDNFGCIHFEKKEPK